MNNTRLIPFIFGFAQSDYSRRSFCGEQPELILRRIYTRYLIYLEKWDTRASDVVTYDTELIENWFIALYTRM